MAAAAATINFMGIVFNGRGTFVTPLVAADFTENREIYIRIQLSCRGHRRNFANMFSIGKTRMV